MEKRNFSTDGKYHYNVAGHIVPLRYSHTKNYNDVNFYFFWATRPGLVDAERFFTDTDINEVVHGYSNSRQMFRAEVVDATGEVVRAYEELAEKDGDFSKWFVFKAVMILQPFGLEIRKYINGELQLGNF